MPNQRQRLSQMPRKWDMSFKRLQYDNDKGFYFTDGIVNLFTGIKLATDSPRTHLEFDVWEERDAVRIAVNREVASSLINEIDNWLEVNHATDCHYSSTDLIVLLDR